MKIKESSSKNLESPNSQENSNMWAMLAHELENFLIGGGAKNLNIQVLTTPQILDWDNETYGKCLSWKMANRIPIWQASYDDGTDRRLDKIYGSFLTNIDIEDYSDEEAKEKADQILKNYEAKKDEKEALETKLGTAWKEFSDSQKNLPDKRKKSFDAWYAEYYGPDMSVITNECNELLGQFVTYSNKAGGGYGILGEALINFNNKAYMMELEDENEAIYEYRMWSLSPSISEFIDDANNGRGNRLSITINKESETTSESQWKFQGSFGHLLGFWGAGGGVSKETFNSNLESFSMTFSAESYTAVSINTAGEWYDGTLLKMFEKGPFKPEGPFGDENENKNELWGEKGLLNLKKTKAIIVYKPSFTARLSREDFEKVETSWNAHGEINIGMFSFKADEDGKEVKSSFDAESCEVSFTSTSPKPQLMAVSSAILPA